MSPFEYAVQPADFEDWAGLHDLLTRSFAYMAGRIDPPSSLHRMNAETLRCKARDEILVIVRHGDRLIACGFLKVDATAV